MPDQTIRLRLVADSSGAVRDVRIVTDEVGRLESASSRVTSAFGAFGGVIAGLGLATLATDALNTYRSFEAMKATLKTMTGSAAAAAGAFADIQEFAATTPHTLDQSVQGFVKLKSLGLDPSMAALKSYGNTASAMGKDLTQMIEAVADASTGEFERLKEFGIKSKSEGDKVTFTFQGVETTVAKSASAIEGYLQSIGNTQFATAMADQADTLNGKISNLQDSWAALQVQMIENTGIADLAKASIGGLADALSGVSGFVANAATDWAFFVDSLQYGDGVFAGLRESWNGFAMGAAGIAEALTPAYEAIVGFVSGLDPMSALLPFVAEAISAASLSFQAFAGAVVWVVDTIDQLGIVAEVGSWFDAASAAMAPFSGALETIGLYVADFAGAFATALGILGSGAAVFSLVAGGIGLVSSAVMALTGVLLANPIGATVAAIAAAAYLIYDNWEGISAFFSGIWESVSSAATGAWDSIKSGASTAGEYISAAFPAQVTVMRTAVSAVTQAMSGDFAGAWQTIKSGVVTAAGQITAQFRAMGQGILSALSGIAGQMYEIGANIVGGLVRGIQSAAGQAVARAREMASNVAGTIKSFFQIQSPSRLMAEYGGHIASGLALGIDAGAGKPKASANKMAEEAAREAKRIADAAAIYRKEQDGMTTAQARATVAMADQADTTNGKISNLQDSWAALQVQIIENTGIADLAKASIGGLADALSGVSGFVTSAATDWAFFVDSLQYGDGVFATVREAWNGFSAVVDAAVAALAPFSGTLETIGLYVAEFAGAFATALGILGSGAAVFSLVAGGIGLVSSAVMALTGVLLANPIGVTVAAIAAAAYLIYDNWEGISAFFSGIWESVSSAASSAWDSIKSGASTAGEYISAAFPAQVTVMRTAVSAVTQAMSGDFAGAWQTIKSGVVTAAGQITAQFRAMGQGILSALSGIAGQMYEIGANIVGGLVRGIQSAAGQAVARAREMASNVAGTIKSFFQIQSPSRLMAEYGGHIATGLAVGIDAEAGKPKASAKKMAEEAAREIAGLQRQLSQVGLGDADKYRAKLSDTGMGAADIETLTGLKNQIDFKTAVSDLARQREQLSMTADGWRELSLARDGYSSQQIATLTGMQRENEHLAEMRRLGDELAGTLQNGVTGAMQNMLHTGNRILDSLIDKLVESILTSVSMKQVFDSFGSGVSTFFGGLFANGASWVASGVRAYAAGEAFHNRILTRPTFFRDRSGQAVAGEEGPEAVMPLTKSGAVRALIQGSGISQTAELGITRINGMLGVSIQPEQLYAGLGMGAYAHGDVFANNSNSIRFDTSVPRTMRTGAGTTNLNVQPKISIKVVNNGQPVAATTTQTTDQNGDTQIAVILDVIDQKQAQGIRSGRSQTAQALSDTFGLRRAGI